MYPKPYSLNGSGGREEAKRQAAQARGWLDLHGRGRTLGKGVWEVEDPTHELLSPLLRAFSPVSADACARVSAYTHFSICFDRHASICFQRLHAHACQHMHS